MADHVAFARKQCQGTVRAVAESLTQGVAVSDEELVLGTAGIFGFFSKVERYPLDTLKDLEFARHTGANVLRLTFEGHPRLSIMYTSNHAAAFDAIAAVLRQRLPA